MDNGAGKDQLGKMGKGTGKCVVFCLGMGRDESNEMRLHRQRRKAVVLTLNVLGWVGWDLRIHLQITRITQGIDSTGYNFKSGKAGKKSKNLLFSAALTQESGLVTIAPFLACKTY